MAQRTRISDPTGLDRSKIVALCDVVESHLGKAIKQAGHEIQQSAEIAKHVEKRTAPSYLHNHSNINSAVMNYIVDLNDLATRIYRYQFIERYRDLVGKKEPNKDLALALVDHTHALKSHETYVILERGSELLKFGFALSSNLNIDGKDNFKSYEKAMKKTFAYRLRERHRMVHAHERPSLMSRMLALDSTTWTQPEAAEVVIKAYADLQQAFQKLQQAGLVRDSGLPRNRTEEWKRCDDEAESMWSIIVEYVRENVGASISVP